MFTLEDLDMDSKYLVVGGTLFKKDTHTSGILTRSITKVGRDYVYVAKGFSGVEKVRKSDLLEDRTGYFESEEAIERHEKQGRLVGSLQEELEGIRNLSVKQLRGLSDEELTSLLTHYREVISKVWSPPCGPGDRIKITHRFFGSPEIVGDELTVKEVFLSYQGYSFLAEGVTEAGVPYEKKISSLNCQKVKYGSNS